jgi:XapX domain-containing protein
MSTTTIVAVAALLTGFVAGAAFAAIGVPIPAPPTITGVLGIVGIYLGYRAIEYLDVGYDLIGAVGP